VGKKRGAIKRTTGSEDVAEGQKEAKKKNQDVADRKRTFFQKSREGTGTKRGKRRRLFSVEIRQREDGRRYWKV